MSKVLIVDDSAFARSNIRRHLQDSGHTILEAASGAAALQIAQEQQPDLVTLDLLMPGMSGSDTLKALKPICPAARYIVVTADIQFATRQELLEAGADAFLNKPVDKTQLLEAAARLLGSSNEPAR